MGGFEPAPSNVMTVPDWRFSGCVGAALVKLMMARSVAAVVVRSFIMEEGERISSTEFGI